MTCTILYAHFRALGFSLLPSRKWVIMRRMQVKYFAALNTSQITGIWWRLVITVRIYLLKICDAQPEISRLAYGEFLRFWLKFVGFMLRLPQWTVCLAPRVIQSKNSTLIVSMNHNFFSYNFLPSASTCSQHNWESNRIGKVFALLAAINVQGCQIARGGISLRAKREKDELSHHAMSSPSHRWTNTRMVHTRMVVLSFFFQVYIGIYI